MAEYVNQTLEEMIPELEEMSRIGLFSVKETKVILRNRQNYEYKLRQLTKTKSSFLNYIEYETKLLELLRIRRKKSGQSSNKREIEKAIADRIHNLYRLACVRFSEDVDLWKAHIEFSKHLHEKSYVSRLYNKMLKIHARREDLWVNAAQWESSDEGNRNPELAREILLQGQRVNPESQIIILEMFRMELELAKLLLKRKAVLGIAPNQFNEEAPQKEVKISELKLSEIIYSKGIEMFPGNFDIHLKMLIISSTFKEAKDLQNLIKADLQRLYPDIPEVWNGLALMHLKQLNKLSTVKREKAIKNCLEVYQLAVDRLPNEKMCSLCLNAQLALMGRREVKNDHCLVKSTLSMFEKAIQLEALTENLYMRLIDLLEHLGLKEDMLKVSVSATQVHPKSSSLWQARLQLMVSLGQGDVDKVDSVLRTSLKHVRSEDSWPLWELVLNHYAVMGFTELEDLIERACRCVTAQVCMSAKEWYLQWTYRQKGIKQLRNVYQRLKSMRPISLDFFKLYVVMESSQLAPKLKLIRSAFEEALLEFGQTEPDLWLNYMQCENEVCKDAARSGEIYQRALVALDPHLKESFIRKHVMLGLVK